MVLTPVARQAAATLCERNKLSTAFHLFRRNFESSKLGIPLDEDFNRMMGLRPLPPASAFNPLLGTLAKARKNRDLLLVVSRMRSEANLVPDGKGLNILLNCYCNLKRTALAFSVLGGILKRGHEPNLITFTTLIKGLLSEGKAADAVSLFKKVIGFGFSPNIQTWSVLTNGLCRTGNAEAALRMHRKNVISNGRTAVSGGSFIPNQIYYSGLIDGLCKSGLVAEAKEIFLEMEAGGVRADAFAYGSLIHGLCDVNEWEEAKGLFNRMIDRGVRPNAVTFNALIRYLCRTGAADEAGEVVNVMMAGRGCERPDAVVFNTLMDGYLLEGRLEDARRLFDSMAAGGEGRLSPDVGTYNVLMNGYFKRVEPEAALDLFQEMLDGDLSPTTATFNVLLKGLFRCRRVEAARDVYSKMRRDHEDAVPNSITYATLVDGFCKNGRLQDAVELFRSLEASGYEADVVICNSLLDGLWKAGKAEAAEEMFGRLMKRDFGVEPDAFTYSIMIRGLCKCGRVEDAYAMMAEMERRGWCEVDVGVMNTMMRGFCDRNDAGRAVEILRKMAAGKQVPDSYTRNIVFGLLSKSEGYSGVLESIPNLVLP